MKLERDESLHEHPDFKALHEHTQQVPGDLPIFADWLREHGADEEADAIQNADGSELDKNGRLVGLHHHGDVDRHDIHRESKPFRSYDVYEENPVYGERDDAPSHFNWPQHVHLLESETKGKPVYSWEASGDGTTYRPEYWYTDRQHAIDSGNSHADRNEIPHPYGDE